MTVRSRGRKATDNNSTKTKPSLTWGTQALVTFTWGRKEDRLRLVTEQGLATYDKSYTDGFPHYFLFVESKQTIQCKRIGHPSYHFANTLAWVPYTCCARWMVPVIFGLLMGKVTDHGRIHIRDLLPSRRDINPCVYNNAALIIVA